jgi:hypothetical protein
VGGCVCMCGRVSSVFQRLARVRATGTAWAEQTPLPVRRTLASLSCRVWRAGGGGASGGSGGAVVVCDPDRREEQLLPAAATVVVDARSGAVCGVTAKRGVDAASLARCITLAAAHGRVVGAAVDAAVAGYVQRTEAGAATTAAAAARVEKPHMLSGDVGSATKKAKTSN